jgi:phage recombination protein Bet
MTTNGNPGTALALLATRLQVSEAEVKQSLTETVFKKATDAQMTALCIVANEYGLNPFVKELYAFPSQNGIVPMVSIDGWLRIINEHPQFAGMDIVYADNVVTVGKSKPCPEYIEVTIHRKDRPHTSSPIREYLDECYRGTEPWNGMTRRMLRHKAIMQAARVTMGLHGIFDEDEAADVLAREGKRIVQVGEVYDVVAVEEETGEVIGADEYSLMLEEMKRTQISLESIAKNVAAKAGYQGELTDMPLPVWESLMAGLATMPTKGSTPPDDNIGFTEDAPHPASSTADSQNGDATPDSDSVAAEALSDADGEIPGMDAQAFAATREPAPTLLHPVKVSATQVAAIGRLRKSSGIYEAEFAALLDSYGSDAVGELSKESAEYVLAALKEREAAS